MARTTFPPTNEPWEDALCMQGVFLVFIFVEHIINGGCFVPLFDSGCSAIAFRVPTGYTWVRCTRTGVGREDDCSRNIREHGCMHGAA